MAVPKRRTSKSRRDKRRAHDAIGVPARSKCSQCGEPKLPHRICRSCGTYRGREMLKVDDEE